MSTLEECMPKAFSWIKRKKRYSLNDATKYVIPSQAIGETESILREYGKKYDPNEGLVYWGGNKDANLVTVHAVIAPKTESSYGRVSTSHRANFDFVEYLNSYNLIQIAQVHSHPTSWVDHSNGDDEWAAFKIEGLLSIVVPEYGSKGMLPLTTCGVHLYTQGCFVRLSKKYISKHFLIDYNRTCYSQDFRK
jgi:hypothetical protein